MSHEAHEEHMKNTRKVRRGWMAGLLEFNGTFITNRLYRAIKKY